MPLISRLLLLLSLLPALASAITLHDDAGQTVTLQAPAQRIVALSPHITDILLGLGARGQIAGVVDDHPRPGAWPWSLTGLPVVAGPGSINEERLLALRPDLVLVWQSGLSAQRVQRLRQLGLHVLLIEPKTLDGIATDVLLLGQASGHEATAQQQAASLRQQLASLQKQYGPGRRLRAFYQIALQPLYTLQGGHLVSQALALCGADSIMPPSAVAAPLVNPEFVLQANPDVIVFGEEEAVASRQYWQRFSSLRAVQNGHLLGLQTHELERPGPGMIPAVAMLCGRLAPWR